MADQNVAVKCPVCAAELNDLFPNPRRRRCGYIESRRQPEVPCEPAAALSKPTVNNETDVDRRR